jgi:PAS domain S-box-containing protein
MVRYEPDGTATEIAGWWRGDVNPHPVGMRWELDYPSIMSMVRNTGLPARIDDYRSFPGPAGRIATASGITAGVGVPIVVDGKTWGLMNALSTQPAPLREGMETRLTEFTELVAIAISNTQARDDLRGLADEQAGLRRVATLVARGTDPAAVFDAVCVETGRLIGATSVNLVRFTPDGLNQTMAGWSLRDTHVPTGTRLPIAPDTINHLLATTVAPARVDSYADASSELGRLIRERGIRSEVGAPVIVEGRLWGAVIAGTDRPEPMPPGSEQRVARFADLIATAVANAVTRSELVASRARIVAAGDEARRRIERNLHDGTQQRLVTLGLDFQALRADLPTGEDAQVTLERIGRELESVIEDVREVSRGLHPGLLAQGGLRPALRALARRSPIPVDLTIDIEHRPPESIETAAYYVVSEALTNAAKHSGGSTVRVEVESTDSALRVAIEDDGSGGAEASAGSGLIGLIDRVEALGGRLTIESPHGRGTLVSVALPIDAAPPSDLETPLSVRTTLQVGTADTSMVLAAFEALTDAIYVVDRNGRIALLNPEALRILGYQHQSQLLGRPSHDTIHYIRPDCTPFPAVECPLLRPRVTGETVHVDEDSFVRQDGTLVRVTYSSAPIGLPDGRGAVVLFRESTA